MDLYFMLIAILSSKEAPYLKGFPDPETGEIVRSRWLFDRCREIQANPNGCIDIYAREHYKTTMITFGLTIQNLVNNPELTIGVFSFKNPIAESFLRNVRYELESNELLKSLYPEALYADPRKESNKWSDQQGFIIKRQGNPREPTMEASGMVDGQPVSRHYDIRIYDDCVTADSVSTDEQIDKVREAWENSNNLGKEGGAERTIGTRYHRFDLYDTIIERKAAVPRIHPCYEVLGVNEDGTNKYGPSVLYTEEYLKNKRLQQGPYTFASQMLCDPVSAETQGLNPTWLNYYNTHPREEAIGKNIYLLGDPAHSKKKGSDYTVFMVIGLGSDKNIYLLDLVRERLDLSERGHKLITLQKSWSPLPYGVGYERYGAQADVQFVEFLMENHYGHRFNIKELGGTQAKEDRIRRLVGPMEAGRVWLPRRIDGMDEEARKVNLIDTFVKNEVIPFPFSKHDDMLDCFSRIFDMEMIYPDALRDSVSEYGLYLGDQESPRGSWLSE